jgi:predicted secreted protein
MPDDYDEIKLRVGETTIVQLKGLGTAGYQWTYSVNNNKSLVTISKDFILTDNTSRKNAGQSAEEAFIIKANKKGVVLITFLQQRSWEKNVDPVSQKKIKIVIE